MGKHNLGRFQAAMAQRRVRNGRPWKSCRDHGPGAACAYLMRSFRTRSGPVYWQALIACPLYMRHRADPALARAYFVQAHAADKGMPPLS